MKATTSAESYREEKASGREQSQKERVFDLLKSSGAMSRRDIAKSLGLQLSAVCGRVNSLMAAGQVENKGKAVCAESGKLVHLVRVVPDASRESQGSLF